MLISHIRGLITTLMTSHEPPSRVRSKIMGLVTNTPRPQVAFKRALMVLRYLG